MKRRILALLCIVAILASLLAGCGSKEETPTIKTPTITSITPDISNGGQVSDNQSSGGSFWDQAPAENSSGGSFWDQAPVANRDTYTVYAQVTENWNGAYLWAWSESEGDLFEAWPGEPMNHISGLWYGMEIPVEYDMVIVNSNGSEIITQTWDLETEGKDAWIIWDVDSYLYNNTGTDEWYDDKFEAMGIWDEKSVSDYLNSLSAVREIETGLYAKLEYGFNSHGVQEFAYTYYYDISGMSDAEASQGIQNIREGSREMFGYLGFLEVRDELRNDILVVTFHFRGVDDPDNAREMVSALSEMMGTDVSDMLDRNGNIILESVFTMENAGFDLKLG